jgi:ATP-dependent protease ClpP protease subunit
MNTWFKINAKEEGGSVEVQILEEIGGWGISGQAFMAELNGAIKSPEDVVNILINSPGGSVIEGNFIFNQIKELPNKVVATVSGMAASMASIIAMAADEVLIHENSYLMIHNPWTMALGESDDLRRMADLMDGMKDSAVLAYQRHTDLSAEKISEMMDEETWLKGLDAVAMGFASEMLDALDIAAVVTEIPDKVKAMVKLEAVEEENDTEESENELEESPDTPVEDDANADVEPDDTGQVEPDTQGAESGQVDMSADLASLKLEVTKQTEIAQKLQSERDKIRAELEKVREDHKQEISDADAKVAEARASLAKLTSPGFEFDSEPQVMSWADAVKECGGDYVKARKTYPGLYKEFMDNQK